MQRAWEHPVQHKRGWLKSNFRQNERGLKEGVFTKVLEKRYV